MKLILEVRKPNDKWEIYSISDSLGHIRHQYNILTKSHPQNKYRLMQIIKTNEGEDE